MNSTGGCPSPEELEAARKVLFDPLSGDNEKLQAAQVFGASLSTVQQVQMTAALTAMRSKSLEEGFLKAIKAGAGSQTVNMYGGTMNNKTGSDNVTISGNNNGNIATSGGAASSNTGQQQGVNVGQGSATVTQASQNAQPDDTFDAAAFEKELTEVLHMLVDRIEEIEGTEYLEAQQVLTSLKKAELATAKTLADVQTMLEDMWDESMKKKYGNLSKALGADGALAQALKLAPSLIALLSGAGAG